MRRFIDSFAVCALVCISFTGAVVLGQAGGGAPAPARAKTAKSVIKEPAVESNAKTPSEKAEVAKTVASQKGLARKAVVRNVAQVNRAPLVQQFTNQARPLLRAELIFARGVCQLNREELRRVNQDAQKMLDEVITKLVDAQFQPRVQVQIWGRAPNNLDAQQLLKDGVASVMKKDLTAGQWSLYEAERAQRDENRKRTTIRYFIDAIDRELYLTQEQRDQLEASFKDKWDASWSLYLENHLYGNRYYPMTIDPLVTPILSDAQKKVWQGVQKVGVYWGFAGMLGGFTNDADGLEIELGEAARPQQDPNRVIGVRQVEMQGAGVFINPELAPAVRIRAKGVKSLKAAPGKPQAQPAPPIAEQKVEKTKD